MSEILRIVHKLRYDQQTYHSIPAPTNTLGESSLRVRTQLIGLSNNNLSYCLGGTVLHWWNAFPVPSTAPAPYSNSGDYGVAPGWGYATVIDSRIDGIGAGRIVYGFLPISSHTIDLKLKPSEVPGQCIEVSSHRSQVMSMYQRYDIMPECFDITSSLAAWTAALIRCEAGMTLATYVFPQDGKEPIHPLGSPVSPWTSHEANLKDACFVTIASGTKTAKAFIWYLANIGQHKTPEYSLVEVTSGAGCKAYIKDIPFNHKVVSYESVSSSNPFPSHRKYIFLNFGGRGNALEEVYNAIRSSYTDAEIVVLQIGSEPMVGTRESVLKRQQLGARLNAVQMNTTGIRDEAVNRLGEREYFKDLAHNFETLLAEQISAFDGRVLGLTLTIGQGLQSESGIDGFWNHLFQDSSASTEAMAIRL